MRAVSTLPGFAYSMIVALRSNICGANTSYSASPMSISMRIMAMVSFTVLKATPDLIFADVHEDGQFLYPGTGAANETGKAGAKGTKLNVPMPPGAGDEEFEQAWGAVESFIDAGKPEFIILQCGADSLEGDPITHLKYTEEAHAMAASRLCALADRHCAGRIVATGGGGYNRRNLARAWTRVVQAFTEA